MNRRVQGKVRQARRRAQKRADIKAGRRMSMQQMLHNHAHQAEGDGESVELDQAWNNAPVETHELVYKANGNMIARGTEYAMRKERAKLGAEYSVRKIRMAVNA